MLFQPLFENIQFVINKDELFTSKKALRMQGSYISKLLLLINKNYSTGNLPILGLVAIAIPDS